MLSKWPPAQKRRFVKFVTGSDRLPPRGTEVITLQMAYAEIGRRRPGQKNSTLGMLPQAHTCFNELVLPPAHSKAQLLDVLQKAIVHGVGFGSA